MDAEKRKRYENIAAELTRLAGGRNNILGIAHCATRLRLVLEDNDKADIHAIEDVDLVKGVFVAGDQLQIIFGAGLVNDVCQVLADSLHMDSMSLGDLKTKANKRMNPVQRAVKALSDVFIEIMPGILAAALLTGLSSVLGNIDFVQNNDTLYGLSRLINISSGAIFGFLPLCVAYSTVKRFGGRPIMGIVIVRRPAHHGNCNRLYYADQQSGGCKRRGAGNRGGNDASYFRASGGSDRLPGWHYCGSSDWYCNCQTGYFL